MATPSGNNDAENPRELYADVTLKLDDGTTLLAHKGILAANSSVLRRLFSDMNACQGSTHEIPLPGCKHEDVAKFLNFLYYGSASAALSFDDMSSLLSVAHMLEATVVVAACTNRLDYFLLDTTSFPVLIRCLALIETYKLPMYKKILPLVSTKILTEVGCRTKQQMESLSHKTLSNLLIMALSTTSTYCLHGHGLGKCTSYSCPHSRDSFRTCPPHVADVFEK